MIQNAQKIAKLVVDSPLVKTAIAGEDANWGRIVMAIGKSYEPIDQNKLKIISNNNNKDTVSYDKSFMKIEDIFLYFS